MFFMEIDRDIVSSRIREKMDELGWNQSKLAQEAGITNAAMSQILNRERTPSTGVLLKIASALKESVDYLLGRKDKTDLTDILSDKDVQVFYRNFSTLSEEDRRQILDMVNFLKARKKQKR